MFLIHVWVFVLVLKPRLNKMKTADSDAEMIRLVVKLTVAAQQLYATLILFKKMNQARS